MTDAALVVVGTGHAGSELAIAARHNGWAAPIVLVGEENTLPYHRPPLSKGMLVGTSDEASLAIRPLAAYEAAGVALRLGARLEAIDPRARSITLESGETLRYAKLALCLGGRPRPWSCVGMESAAKPSNLHYLRNLQDAKRIQADFAPGKRLVVIGGGYVGLEVAASAIKLGLQVTLLEQQERVLARVAGRQMSAFFEDVHRTEGVRLRTSTMVARVTLDSGKIVALETEDGERIEADVVVAGVGMLANVESAVSAGIADAGGIPVNEHARTRDADIYAAGDCTVQHSSIYARTLRLESVHNALEQARAAAAHLCGKPRANNSVPWFWSDQYDLKLQLVGLSHGYDQCVVRGDPASRSFSALYLRGETLLAVDAVNRPIDFMAAKRALIRPVRLDVTRAVDPSVTLTDAILG